MSPDRHRKIVQTVRLQIVHALEEDLCGGESIMKEAWEACEDEDEDVAAKEALREVIEAIRAMEPCP